MADDNFSDKEGHGGKKKKNGPKAGTKAKPVAAGADPIERSESGNGEPTISLFLAVGISVAALIIGLIGGYILAPKGATSDFGQPAPTGAAPSLTPDQINSGQLPASHPPVPGLGGETSGTQSNQTPGQEKSETGTPAGKQ